MPVHQYPYDMSLLTPHDWQLSHMIGWVFAYSLGDTVVSVVKLLCACELAKIGISLLRQGIANWKRVKLRQHRRKQRAARRIEHV